MIGSHASPAVMIPTGLPLSPALTRLIADANEESARLNHQYLGTEHLALALSRPAEASVLMALGVEPQRLYDRITEIVRVGDRRRVFTGVRPLTSGTRRAFLLADGCAHELGHAHLGVSHLLVGVLREQLNIAAQVLTDEGLTTERALEAARERGA